MSKTICIVFFFCAATAILSPAQTVSTLLSFDGYNGAEPLAALVEGPDGNFYGTTSQGGINGPFSDGTVFKVTPNGTLTTLHDFNGGDGSSPQIGLLHATDGNFYGTTSAGGASNYGTIFRITASGAFTLLYSFRGSTDGREPGPLIQASDGNFYGTAAGGGNDNCESTGGCGVIFKVTPQGNFSKIYQFQGSSNDGYNPGWLVQGRDGNFYGMTSGGGGYGCNAHCGSVFKVTTGGRFTTLHWFNFTDGSAPSGQLLQLSDGNFYGTTSVGGPYFRGTVFKITPSGTLTSLYSFCHQYNCPDGATPFSGLMQATDGTLYGTTLGGGVYGCSTCGTIFKITTNGSLTTLFSFNDTSTGGSPGGLLQASNGNFYGLASVGGTGYPNYGTFFQFYTTGRTLYTSTSGSGTVSSTDGSINCPGTCSHIYPDNTPVTLNASPAQGWAFTGWSGACTGTGSCNIVMTQDQSVAASFSPLYTLTVTTNGNGSVRSTDGFINCPGVCSHVYVANSSVTLNNFPAQGWSFNSWSGACVGNYPTCIVFMSADHSVGATFTQDSYTLTTYISGQGTITSTDGSINCPGTCSHTYLSLTQVTLNATPAEGWNFSGWSGACTGVGPCNITMTGNLGASAYFLQPGSGLQFISAPPCRLVDTRQTGNPIRGGTAQDFPIPQLGNCNIPANATAYSLNVTVVPQLRLGYLTVWPAGQAQPNISTMNSPDGRTKANAAIVPAGVNGAISVFASNTTDVILDINGYFTAPGDQTYAFYSVTPCRVIDTRFPNGSLGSPSLAGGTERDFPTLESSCIPQNVNNIKAYSLNFAVLPTAQEPHQALGYLTVWSTGEPQPAVSTLNNPTATTVANAAIVPAGTGGAISVLASNDTDLVVDVNGYFAPAGSGGLSLYPTAPCRVLDTRDNNGPPFVGEKTVNVTGSVCAPPVGAQVYVLNATVVPPGRLGYLTLWPDTGQQPEVSTLNAVDGFLTSNMAIVPTLNGSIDAFASNLTQLLLDISSYFAP
ncbi:MAG TPA: choice-of-anchor tandem repeat GloVer-containing protein [Candidatus Binatia bacterium]|nr:choice-of-anchor tandem repeat GloVer-containing protein [Candidatus Binatia bacterium]